eukprot:SAG11_NODE_2373_length_3445_cov_11.317693_3_plen_91_part_00
MVVAVPRPGGEHVLLDMATSQFSNGKLEIMRKQVRRVSEIEKVLRLSARAARPNLPPSPPSDSIARLAWSTSNPREPLSRCPVVSAQTGS